MNTANAIYGMLAGGAVFFVLWGGLIFLFVWPVTAEWMLVVLAWFVGLMITITLKFILVRNLRSCELDLRMQNGHSRSTPFSMLQRLVSLENGNFAPGIE